MVIPVAQIPYVVYEILRETLATGLKVKKKIENYKH